MTKVRLLISYRGHSATHRYFYDKTKIILQEVLEKEYQPSGAGGTQSMPEKYKMAARGPKMTNGVWNGVYP